MKILKIQLHYGEKYPKHQQEAMQEFALDDKPEFNEDGSCSNSYHSLIIEADSLRTFTPCVVLKVLL